MSSENRRHHSSEFKLEAVKLILNGRSTSEVAAGLGISPAMLSRWKREYLKEQTNAFPGKGYLKPEQQRIKDLEKQVRDLEEERNILKKAVAIFSRRTK
jgi:transposase